MTVLGQLALWLALLLGVWGAVVGWMGGQRGDPVLIRSARRTTFALAGLMSVAALGLIVALLKNDFNVSYVASYSSRNLPTAYKLSAFYGGQAGSLLFWGLVLSLFAAAATPTSCPTSPR
jgi:cytochrome c-type biogenesis protein CcmF